jgi:hypothetical protein
MLFHQVQITPMTSEGFKIHFKTKGEKNYYLDITNKLLSFKGKQLNYKFHGVSKQTDFHIYVHTQ